MAIGIRGYLRPLGARYLGDRDTGPPADGGRGPAARVRGRRLGGDGARADRVLEPALRNAVDLALHTRFPVSLLWGPEFVMVYKPPTSS
jgi:hypothetical protein